MDIKKLTTKEALIFAGLKLLRDYGVPTTSTRMLAEYANVNLAAIKYHFGSKEGLYHAVIEHITSKMKASNKDFIQSIMLEINGSSISVPRAKEICKKLYINMANMLIANDESKDWAKIIMREQANPTSAFDIMYKGHMQRLQSTLLKLGSVIYSCEIDNTLLAIRQQLLFGQVLVFIVAQESFRRAINGKNVKSLKDDILKQISLCIDAIMDTPLA